MDKLAIQESAVPLDLFRITSGCSLVGLSACRWWTASGEPDGLILGHLILPATGSVWYGVDTWLRSLDAQVLWGACTLFSLLLLLGLLPRLCALLLAWIIMGRIDAGAPGANCELVVAGFVAFWLAILPIGTSLLPPAIRTQSAQTNGNVSSGAITAFLICVGVLYANARFWRSAYTEADTSSVFTDYLWIIAALMVYARSDRVSRVLLFLQPATHLVLWIDRGMAWAHLLLASTTLLSCRGLYSGRLPLQRHLPNPQAGSLSNTLAYGCVGLCFLLLLAQAAGSRDVAVAAQAWIHDLGCPWAWLRIR